MNRESSLELARRGELYPSVILHGGTEEARRELAVELARTLLCEAAEALRPCGQCRNCRRIAWPEGAGTERFHPDFHVLLRDLKTSTSVEAAKNLLRPAQISPFEARGQVFVVANAETLSVEAANSLLKTLEEPHTTAPRHFFLLAPSRLDLLSTLRSRSLALFLGASEAPDAETVEELSERFAGLVTAWAASGSGVYLLAAADTLKEGISGWDEVRSNTPWGTAAAVVTAAVRAERVPRELRRRTLALAEALLRAPGMRLRSIAPERILEGLCSRHLAGPEREAV